MIKTIYRYWRSDESNIFGDYKDALFGLVVLVLLPSLSLFSIWKTQGFVCKLDNMGTVFWAYSFPLISVGTSGIFDAIARLEVNAQKNFKLGARIFFNFLAVLLAGAMGGQEKIIPRLIPAFLLTINGLLLLQEIWANIVMSIRLSPWAAKENKD